MSQQPGSGITSTKLDTTAASADVTWPPDHSDDIRHAETIGDYRLIERIGAGGMGVVYKAEQLRPVRRTVAIKIIKLGMDTPQLVERFNSERQALAMLEHPGIARVYDAGATADTARPYFVMEYVPGRPITDYCDERRMTTSQRLELFEQVCHAVQYAHFKGILHRDLKPSNILVSEIGGRPQIKVIDFGVAKAMQDPAGAGGATVALTTRAGQLVGTPVYMSPEQAAGDADVDTRADVYSLGLVLYELLVGALPFDLGQLRGNDSIRIVQQILEREPSRPSMRLSSPEVSAAQLAQRRGVDTTTLRRQVRGDLDRIVMKAIHKDRAQRYATAAALAEDVRRHLNHEPIMARPPTLAYQARKFARRNRVFVTATAMVVLAAVIGGAAATYGLIRARQALAESQQSRAVAQNVSDFLRDMLRSVDPKRAQGDPVLVRDVLDHAAADLHNRFADQPVVKASLHAAIGDTYHALGLFPQALEHERTALEMRREVLGPDHPDTLDIANTLGSLLFVTGRFGEAEPLLRDVLDRRRRTVGPDAPVTTVAEQTLSLVLLATDRPQEAQQLMLHVLDVRRRAFGEDHEETLDALHNMAPVEEALGRLEESERLLRAAATGRERVLGPNHPKTLISMNNLGSTLALLNRPAEAEPILRECLSRSEPVLGENHKNTLETMSNLAYVLQELDKFPEAEQMYRAALERLQRVLPANHRSIFATMGNLATVLEQQQKIDEALALFKQIHERARDAGLPVLAQVRYRVPYGERLVKHGRLDEAEDPLLEGKAVLEAANMADSQRMRDLLLCLARVCEHKNRPADASRWRDEARAISAAAAAATTEPSTRSTSQPSR
jgi:non-specific serine/threonine protein kinase/serine/threonine-protein kinase